MAWPKPAEYRSVIQTPANCFADKELVAGTPAGDMLGLPLMYSGNFANVYRIKGEKTDWAVKCFTREVPGLQDRYAAISDHLERNRRRFAVEFKYLDQGIKVNGEWFPILKMRWVEGFMLNDFLREHAGNAQLLEKLCGLWQRLGTELRQSEMAHADLQHGNVLLVPPDKTGGNEKESWLLRLIDYDGMWVPELAGKPPGEVGHPNYQHPGRTRESYSAEIDRFAHLVIYTAFRCLAVGGMKLWDKFDNEDNMLFKERDFSEPAKSKLWPELLTLNSHSVVTLAGHLLVASQQPLDKVPLLNDLLDNGKIVPLTSESRDLIRTLVPTAKLTKLPPPVPTAPPPIPIVPPVPAQEGALDWLTDPSHRLDGSVRKSKVILTPISAPLPDSGSGRSRINSDSPPAPVPTIPIPMLPLEALPVEDDEAVETVRVAPIAIAVAEADVRGMKPLPAIPLDHPYKSPDASTVASTALANQTATAGVAVGKSSERSEERRGRNEPIEGKNLFGTPDWLVGLGLNPNSPVVRFWPIVLGAVLAIPLLAVLVWFALPAPRPREVPQQPTALPTLRESEVVLVVGQQREVDFTIDNVPDAVRNGTEPVPYKLELANLPFGVQLLQSGPIPGGGPILRARFSVREDVNIGTFNITAKVVRPGINRNETLGEKVIALKTQPYLRPLLGEVTGIELTQGEAKDYSVPVFRNGNNEKLSLSVEPLPRGVRPEELVLPGDRVGVRLTVDASAEVGPPRNVQIVLRAGGVVANVKVVVLSLRSTAGPKTDAAIRLVCVKRLLFQDTTTSLVVRLDRGPGANGAVMLKSEEPAGVTCPAVEVPAGQVFARLNYTINRLALTAPRQELPVKLTALMSDRQVGSEEVTLVFGTEPNTPFVPKPKQKVTAQNLNGDWSLTSTIVKNVGTLPWSEVRVVQGSPSRWTFVSPRAKTTYSYTMVIGENQEPATIDLTLTTTKAKSGVTFLGIARFKGEQIEILMVPGSRSRPEDFNNPPDGAYFLTLTKKK